LSDPVRAASADIRVKIVGGTAWSRRASRSTMQTTLPPRSLRSAP